MKLNCYALVPEPLPLRPAPSTRAWMDAIPNNHAYRCLPLSIANAHGWEIGAPCDFEATWNGWPKASDIKIKALDGFPNLESLVVSHFAFGILTFHLTYLFRTEPGWDLLATGPFNQPKDGIAPLTGVIETHWLPYPFTMNWQMTRPGTVRFARDEPICQIVPVPSGALAEVVPEIRNLDDDPELKAQTFAWKERRDDFMRRFRAHDPSTLKEAWQRYYFVGKNPDGTEADAEHVSKLRLATPIDRRGEPL